FKRATKLRYTRTSGPVFSPATLFIIAHPSTDVNSFFKEFSKKFNAFDFSLFSPVVGLNPSAALPEHSKRGSLAAASFCVYAID
uniref:hypothetical protein n=1 Tax=uncultured Allofournierella sp. TaxID=1940258 RepID=UPI0025FBF227